MNDKDMNKNLTQEADPMYVDKKIKDMEEQAVEGGFHVAHADDSKASALDAISYEDHQQVYGEGQVVGTSEETHETYEKTPGSADNVKDTAEEGEKD